MQYVSAVNSVNGVTFTAGLIGVISIWQRVWQRVKEGIDYDNG